MLFVSLFDRLAAAHETPPTNGFKYFQKIQKHVCLKFEAILKRNGPVVCTAGRKAVALVQGYFSNGGDFRIHFHPRTVPRVRRIAVGLAHGGRGQQQHHPSPPVALPLLAAATEHPVRFGAKNGGGITFGVVVGHLLLQRQCTGKGVLRGGR